MLCSTMYLSHSRLTLPADAAQVSAIHHLSVARNRDLNLTGLLVVTPRNFAQYLEGEGDAVSAVMTSICRDLRHERVVIVPPPQISYRRFPTWRLTWLGPDRALTDTLQPIFDDIETTAPEDRATTLLHTIEALSSDRVY
ncbi:putative Sensors of blue-light using FAD [Sphingomonas sp. EC-HK361]|nr:putative Sensors of blue-light using FAD [Sphingomonas sp. EC-HK361]